LEALIAILPGDGIGPEVTQEGVRVLDAIAEHHGHRFELREALIGGAALDAHDIPAPEATLDLAREADAALLGAVGGPKWNDVPGDKRPERGLLNLRTAMNTFANVRPVVPHEALRSASPIKEELLVGVDMIVVRELTGGIYFGEKQRSQDSATDVCTYTREEIERVLAIAGQLAQKRKGRVTSVDKSNVLETSRLWQSVAKEFFAREFPELEIEHLLVDAAAMHLLSRPRDFDVIVTENMFGDILTDEASMLAGSMGMLPSASLNETKKGLYEPIHGSAPDIAGQGIANPCGFILSVAMLLRHSLGLEAEAAAVETAVFAALDQGYRTADIAVAGKPSVTTREMGDAIVAGLPAGD
jgi:3-isopropylmalate dehydrogenase